MTSEIVAVYRWRSWSSRLGVALVIGIGVIGMITIDLVVGLVATAVIAAISLPLLFIRERSAVTVTREGLTVTGFRTRTYRWSEIAGVEIRPPSGRFASWIVRLHVLDLRGDTIASDLDPTRRTTREEAQPIRDEILAFRERFLT